jgi:hypothetical protein
MKLLEGRIEHLTNMLNLRCSELEELIGREKEIYRVLGGVGGEHPLERAKRVVAERSTLADKVNVKVRDITQLEHNARIMSMEMSELTGKMKAILAISES